MTTSYHVLELLTLLGFNKRILSLEKSHLIKHLSNRDPEAQLFLEKKMEEEIIQLRLLTTDIIKCYKQLEICKRMQLKDELFANKEKEYDRAKFDINEKLKELEEESYNLKFLKLSIYCEARCFGKNNGLSLEKVMKILEEINIVSDNKPEVFIVGLLSLPLCEIRKVESPKWYQCLTRPLFDWIWV